MPDSAPSPIVTAASPAQAAPMPPTIDSVTFVKLVATITVNLPMVDVNGDLLAEIKNLKTRFGIAGSDLSTVPWQDNIGPGMPGGQVTAEMIVPEWATAYDFETEIST